MPKRGRIKRNLKRVIGKINGNGGRSELTKEERFEAVFDSHALDVYRASLYLTRDEKVAEEITQEAFVRFYDYFENVNPECYLAYLVRTVRELAADCQKPGK